MLPMRWLDISLRIWLRPHAEKSEPRPVGKLGFEASCGAYPICAARSGALILYEFLLFLRALLNVDAVARRPTSHFFMVPPGDAPSPFLSTAPAVPAP